MGSALTLAGAFPDGSSCVAPAGAKDPVLGRRGSVDWQGRSCRTVAGAGGAVEGSAVEGPRR